MYEQLWLNCAFGGHYNARLGLQSDRLAFSAPMPAAISHVEQYTANCGDLRGDSSSSCGRTRELGVAEGRQAESSYWRQRRLVEAALRRRRRQNCMLMRLRGEHSVRRSDHLCIHVEPQRIIACLVVPTSAARYYTVQRCRSTPFGTWTLQTSL